MSYCRFGWEGSDAYIYMDVDGFICCLGCTARSDLGSFKAYSTSEMLRHIEYHRSIGDHIPANVDRDLIIDNEENMRMIIDIMNKDLQEVE